jgi:RHS repeat-associated protein
VNSVTTNYTLDLNAGLTQVLADGESTYLYGLGRIAQLSAEETAFFLGDALGSVRQLTDGSGVITHAAGYTPYGEVLASAGNGSNYGYTGEWTDASGMVYLRARYYSPWQGRFMTRDTWGGRDTQPLSYNMWLYVNGNPINRVDPSGNTPEQLGIEFTATTGSWSDENKRAVISAVIMVGNRFWSALGMQPPVYWDTDSYTPPTEIFKSVYGIDNTNLMNFEWHSQIDPDSENEELRGCYNCRPKVCIDDELWEGNHPTDGCSCTPMGGYTHGSRHIEFASLWDEYYGAGGVPIQNLRKINNVIHELGHAFNDRLGGYPAFAVSKYTVSINGEDWEMNSRINTPDKFGLVRYGFYEDAERSGTRTWVQSGQVDPGGSEVFADMFLGWVYNKWAMNVYGNERARFMNEHMKGWIMHAMMSR